MTRDVCVNELQSEAARSVGVQPLSALGGVTVGALGVEHPQTSHPPHFPTPPVPLSLPVCPGPAKSFQAMAKIQYTTPDGTTGEVELTAERMTLGRADDNQLIIPDASVSSHHGEVALDGDTWVLTDLGSTNGTKVDGNRVERVELGDGGAFALGNVECVFVGEFQSIPHTEPVYHEPVSRTLTSTGGYGEIAIDRGRRTGFGVKAKEKNSGNGLLMTLGVIALLACGGAIFMFTQMTA